MKQGDCYICCGMPTTLNIAEEDLCADHHRRLNEYMVYLKTRGFAALYYEYIRRWIEREVQEARGKDLPL
jgi:hypothetical protein